MTKLIAIPVFFAIGAGIKYVDAAFDDGTFTRRYAIVLSIAMGFLLGLCMVIDHELMVLSLAIIMGVFLTGKLDILPFRLLVLVAILTLSLGTRGTLQFTSHDQIVFLIFTLGAAVDEIGNDLADAHLLRGAGQFFFLNRGSIKFLALVFLTFTFLRMIPVLALLGFDLGYFIVTGASHRRQQILKLSSRSTSS